MGMGVVIVLGLLGLVIVSILMVVRVMQEYERAVVFRLGRLVGTKGPGPFLIIPIINRVVRVDLRTVTMGVPPQEVITRDNVTVKVDAVVYFKVVNAESAVVEVLDYIAATSQIAQTTLRSVLGTSELDELLSQRERINLRLQQIIDKHTEPWGVKVSTVEIKDVHLPEPMQRAMARQAEAEREKRAKVIHAEGEYQASETLAKAAYVVGTQPAALQLRYLQTLTEIAAEKNSTIIFPLPVDILTGLTERLKKEETESKPAVPVANL